MEGLGVSAGPGTWGIPVFTAATSTHRPRELCSLGLSMVTRKPSSPRGVLTFRGSCAPLRSWFLKTLP